MPTTSTARAKRRGPLRPTAFLTPKQVAQYRSHARARYHGCRFTTKQVDAFNAYKKAWRTLNRTH